MEVLAFKEDLSIQPGVIQEGVLVPQETSLGIKSAFEGFLERMGSEVVREFKARAEGELLGREALILSRVLPLISKPKEGDFNECISFSVKLEKPDAELLLTGLYVALDPALNPPPGLQISLLGAATFGTWLSVALKPSNPEEAAGLLAYYPCVGVALRELAEKRGSSAWFGLVWGPASSRKGLLFGAGPALAAELASLDLPGYAGFYSEARVD